MLRRANNGQGAQHISLVAKIVSGKKTGAYVMDAFFHLQPRCAFGRWTRCSSQRPNHIIVVAFVLWRAPPPPACMTRISTKSDFNRDRLVGAFLTGRPGCWVFEDDVPGI